MCYLRSNTWDYTVIDNLHLPDKKMYGFSSTSDVWVNEKWKAFRNPSLNSQAKLDALAEKLRDRHKFPIKRVHVPVKGTIHLRHPGWMVAVDLPDEGISNPNLSGNYRVVEYSHVYDGDRSPIRGYPWVTILDLVSHTASPDTLYVGTERLDRLLNFDTGELASIEKRATNLELYDRKMISGEASIVSYT
jgi:hypothetical protein